MTVSKKGPACPDHLGIQMVKKEIKKVIKKFHKILVNEGIKVKKIILYGSFATGAKHKDSDIDVAVISDDFGKDRFNEGVMLHKIAYKIDPRIEPVPISSKSYQNDNWIPLIYEIKKKGVEVTV